MLLKETLSALSACIVTLALSAGVYPLAVWGLGQVFFAEQAEGSLLYSRDRTVIGKRFGCAVTSTKWVAVGGSSSVLSSTLAGSARS